jgi:predicted DNA-binding transcriptional regulator AlpA
LESAGKFPKRVQISEARVGWLEREIDEYVKVRVNART